MYCSAAARPNIIQGPEPSPLRDGTVPLPPYLCDPLFLPGTDGEVERVQEDLVVEERVDEEVAGTDGQDDDVGGRGDDEDTPPSPKDVTGMDVDEDSPPPTKKARRLRQEPRILFVFDDTTGDLVEPHPTIFLSRPTVPPAQSSDTSPVNPDAAHLKLTQGTKSDATKKKKEKDAKGKDKKAETAVPRKRSRDDDDGAPTVERPASKKLKSNDHKVADNKGVKMSGIFVLLLIFFG